MNPYTTTVRRTIRLLLLPFALLICTQALAQSTIDLVELKNGSVIRGTIVEQVVGETIKIKTSDGSLFVYRMEEVARIRKEAVAVQNSAPADMDDYGGILGLGVSIGGGGLLGIHARSAPHPNIALEAGVSFFPTLTYKRITIYDHNGNVIREQEESKFVVAPILNGGLDIFFGQSYRSFDRKIVRNGLMIRGGTSLSLDVEQSMFATGWARERYKEGRKTPSYCFGLGLGAWFYTDPDDNPLSEVLDEDLKVLPMIYWKFHWNWYVVKKGKK